jgi:single-strand DNA-binding protein
MPNLNKVMLMGNLTRDPESKFLPSGTPVCELGMAINRFWTDQGGERKEQTCFVDLTAFGRQAETLGRFMKKGRPLYVEGRLDFQQWETPEGQKRSKLKVIVENFQFLGGRDDAAAGGEPGMGGGGNYGGGGGGRSGGGGGGYGGGGPSAAPSDPAPQFERSAPALDDDDIPF